MRGTGFLNSGGVAGQVDMPQAGRSGQALCAPHLLHQTVHLLITQDAQTRAALHHRHLHRVGVGRVGGSGVNQGGAGGVVVGGGVAVWRVGVRMKRVRIGRTRMRRVRVRRGRPSGVVCTGRREQVIACQQAGSVCTRPGHHLAWALTMTS